jgi:hypothetical protein
MSWNILLGQPSLGNQNLGILDGEQHSIKLGLCQTTRDFEEEDLFGQVLK